MASKVWKSGRPRAETVRGDPGVRDRVAGIIADVRSRGDAAVREYSARFDSWTPNSFRLPDAEIERIVSSLPAQVVDDIRFAQEQVRTFARHQRDALRDFEVETMPGVRLGQRNIQVGAVGAYVPGGRYPLTASAHMTIVTAKVAGVSRVTACTPPIRGEVPTDEIHLVGGVQAVAAMAVGTETIGAVDLLAGPGNAYVAEAKRQLYGEVGIDLFAGPTEILVVADGTADPFVVAVDLLSQAEHGPDSPAVLVTTSPRLAEQVLTYVDELLPGMPTSDMAGPAWRDHGEVLAEEPRRTLDAMRNYGALFLGEGTCVSYGDKVIGTNHVLPTRGAASRVELFEGHARSGDVRAAKYGDAVLDWTDHTPRTGGR